MHSDGHLVTFYLLVVQESRPVFWGHLIYILVDNILNPELTYSSSLLMTETRFSLGCCENQYLSQVCNIKCLNGMAVMSDMYNALESVSLTRCAEPQVQGVSQWREAKANACLIRMVYVVFVVGNSNASCVVLPVGHSLPEMAEWS